MHTYYRIIPQIISNLPVVLSKCKFQRLFAINCSVAAIKGFNAQLLKQAHPRTWLMDGMFALLDAKLDYIIVAKIWASPSRALPSFWRWWSFYNHWLNSTCIILFYIHASIPWSKVLSTICKAGLPLKNTIPIFNLKFRNLIWSSPQNACMFISYFRASRSLKGLPNTIVIIKFFILSYSTAVREDRMPGGRNSGAVYNLYKVPVSQLSDHDYV